MTIRAISVSMPLVNKGARTLRHLSPEGISADRLSEIRELIHGNKYVIDKQKLAHAIILFELGSVNVD